MRLLTGRLSLPVVAAVNGTAVAGRLLEILLGCDVIVASFCRAFSGFPR